MAFISESRVFAFEWGKTCTIEEYLDYCTCTKDGTDDLVITWNDEFVENN